MSTHGCPTREPRKCGLAGWWNHRYEQGHAHEYLSDLSGFRLVRIVPDTLFVHSRIKIMLLAFQRHLFCFILFSVPILKNGTKSGNHSGGFDGTTNLWHATEAQKIIV
jgi:hypothetical protein